MYYVIMVLVLLAGCTIQQDAKPVTLTATDPHEICVINNSGVRENFLPVYEDALRQRGLQPRVVPEGTAPRACPLTTAYTARWAWDLALYLAYAELRVYRDGRLAGEVRYDSSAGGLNFGKFVDARKKIEEMTRQLFAG